MPFKQTRIGVHISQPPHLFLGTYHLRGVAQDFADFVQVLLVNMSGHDQVFHVEVEVPGVTDKMSKNETLLHGKTDVMLLTPPLRADFKPATQSAVRPSQVTVKVTDGAGKLLFEDARPISVFPRDQFPMEEQGPDAIAAFVTPQIPAVEDFMAAAKKRVPDGKLGGVTAPTVPQVKAIYDELHARGMSYVLVTDFGYDAPQHVRMPADALRSTNALCLDGAVLFATLMEELGLRPIVIFVPQHAFVGWHAEASDNAAPGTIYWLETTVVATKPFECALRDANAEHELFAGLGAMIASLKQSLGKVGPDAGTVSPDSHERAERDARGHRAGQEPGGDSDALRVTVQS